MSYVEQFIEDIVKPGHGYGRGCRIVARRRGETDGVEWTRITVVPNDLGAQKREQIYLTESGHKIEHCVGSYGDGIRWAFSGPGVEGWPQGSHVSFASNLTRAFRGIARAQKAQASLPSEEKK